MQSNNTILQLLENERIAMQKIMPVKIGVAALINDDTNKTLLLLRNNNPDANSWSIPGGKVDFDECFACAIKREIKEEVGLDVIIKDLLVVTRPVDRDGIPWFSPVFLVDIKSDHPPKNLEPEKHKEICWFKLTKPPTQLNTTTRVAIETYIAKFNLSHNL